MTFKLNEPDFERHPLTETEAALELLETSWCDFVYGTRVAGYIRSERRKSLRFFGHLEVHRMLDHYRKQFLDGNRTSIFAALVYCIQENVPLPYWLGDVILDVDKAVCTDPSSLHKLFGLESKFPAEGKRARKLRLDRQLQQKLWFVVKELLPEHSGSVHAAVEHARMKLNFPYEQRKSREMFDAQERIQSGFLDALKGTKKHQLK